MKLISSISLIMVWSSLLLGQLKNVDPLNTYQFNRENVLKKNNKVSQTPWFEWWYYKVVLPKKNKAYFFVYGVVNPWDESKTLGATRSYVEMGDFGKQTIIEEQFEVKDFNASYKTTHVQVKGVNSATDKSLRGEIMSSHGEKASWNIQIQKSWTFNAASWMTGKNITNIEWYPAQTDATCSGEIIANGEREVFENAPCYQDRNWGSLFPDWWTWIVSNHFDSNPETTLAIGGGKPTILDKINAFESVAIGLKHKGQEYFWRPHHGDLIRFQIRFGQWEVEAINKNFKISVVAHAPKEKFMDLQFITPQGKAYHDYEALQGHLEVRLYKRSANLKDWVFLDHLTSDQAGIEFGSFDEFSVKNMNQLDLCLLGCKK